MTRNIVLSGAFVLALAASCGAAAQRGQEQGNAAVAPATRSAPAITRKFIEKDWGPLPWKNVHVGNTYVAYKPGSNRAIRDVRIDTSTYFVKNDGEQGWPANDLTIERVEASCFRCVRMTQDSGGTIIRHFRFKGTQARQYATGIQFAGSAHDILVEHGEVSGFTGDATSRYPNADGISTERGNARVTIRDVYSHDNTDGCFDLKSTETVLDDVRAANCARNYRLWGSGHGTTLTSEQESAKSLHLWFDGRADWTIDRLVAIGPGALLRAEEGAQVTVKSCDLSRWQGNKMAVGKGSVKWGKGCVHPRQ